MRKNTWIAIVFLFILWGTYLIFSPAKDFSEIYYHPEFTQLVKNQEIEKAIIRGPEIKAILINGNIVKTNIPENTEIIKDLMDHGVILDIKEPHEKSILASIAPAIAMIAMLGAMFIFNRGKIQPSFGKNRYEDQRSQTQLFTFKDVAGIDEEKGELREIVDFLQDPKKYARIGASIPKGVLLAGPAGTGKTLLAKAVAGEAGVPFFSVSGSEFVEMFVGVGAARVRTLFERARKNAPCIVFIDEIDAVGRKRGAGLGGGHDEKEQTLNQLLVAMDGFSENKGVIVLAATNRPDILDPALLRPGRFDRQIIVGYPDIRGRKSILEIHSKNKPLSRDVDLGLLARRTPGFTGADLANIINEAALLTARRNKRKISMSELEESIDRVMIGTKKSSRVISKAEKKLTAFHEAGHTLIAYLSPHADPVHKVSIIPRGSSGGHTQTLPDTEKQYATRSELLDRISILLAGRIAEEISLNDVSTGAQADLEQATNIARKMVVEHGMSEEVGLMSLGKTQDLFLGRDLVQGKNFSEKTARQIDQAIKNIIDDCYQKTHKVMVENTEKLTLLAEALQKKESLYSQEIALIME